MRASQIEPVTDDLLREITWQIVAAFAPEAVILFGSRTHGQPEPGRFYHGLRKMIGRYIRRMSTSGMFKRAGVSTTTKSGLW